MFGKKSRVRLGKKLIWVRIDKRVRLGKVRFEKRFGWG